MDIGNVVDGMFGTVASSKGDNEIEDTVNNVKVEDNTLLASKNPKGRAKKRSGYNVLLDDSMKVRIGKEVNKDKLDHAYFSSEEYTWKEEGLRSIDASNYIAGRMINTQTYGIISRVRETTSQETDIHILDVHASNIIESVEGTALSLSMMPKELVLMNLDHKETCFLYRYIVNTVEGKKDAFKLACRNSGINEEQGRGYLTKDGSRKWIKTKISEYIEDCDLEKVKIVEELKKIAYGDNRILGKVSNLYDIKNLSEEEASQIKGVTLTGDGYGGVVMNMTLYDKVEALKVLGGIVGLAGMAKNSTANVQPQVNVQNNIMSDSRLFSRKETVQEA